VKNVLQAGLETTENAETTKKTMENAVNIVGQTIQDARTMSYRLHPLMLEELGLTTALQFLLRKTCETFSIQQTSNVEDIDGLFSPEAEVHIFRIVQECLNNVVKHSGATNATLTVRRQKEYVELLLSDNGKGFDATKSGVHRGSVGGFGQKNMKERTRLLGAEMNVTSIISGGTTVSVRCPFKEKAHNG
jgi:signal transduction histidine kinase